MLQVKEQYQRWTYPKPITDMELAIQKGYWEIGDPLIYWPYYWPMKRNCPKGLRILSAGCGTNQAAYYAMRHPDSHVIGIDLSESSLANQQVLKSKHGLNNLELHQHDILRVQELGHEFDLVISTGVIHHMVDPAAGLRALGSCLKPNGIASLMVYSYTLRTGVYMLQRAFRDLGFCQVPDDVLLIRQILATLHPQHPVHRYIGVADDLHDDAGIVDTFLHPQDRAYYAGEIFDLTREAGLEFLSWADPSTYSLDSAVPNAHPLWDKCRGIEPQKEANICDMLTQQTGTHRWFAAKHDYAASIEIPFGNSTIAECFSSLHKDVIVEAPADLSASLPARCKRANMSFEIASQVAEVLRLMGSGVKSIGEAARLVTPSGEDVGKLIGLCDQELKRLWKNGHVYMLLPEQ
jgi:SAM-dependent methyltransferase